MRGQVAFETIFLILVVLSATIIFSSLYINTQDIIVANSIARNEINSQAQLQGELIVIEKIDSTTYDTNTTIVVTIQENNLNKVSINTNLIETHIEENTKIKNAIIQLIIKQL